MKIRDIKYAGIVLSGGILLAAALFWRSCSHPERPAGNPPEQTRPDLRSPITEPAVSSVPDNESPDEAVPESPSFSDGARQEAVLPEAPHLRTNDLAEAEAVPEESATESVLSVANAPEELSMKFTASEAFSETAVAASDTTEREATEAPEAPPAQEMAPSVPALPQISLSENAAGSDEYGEADTVHRRKWRAFLASLLVKPKPKVDRGILNELFIPRGQWMGGVSFGYSEYSSENFDILLLKSWDGIGYTLRTVPYFAYFYRNNKAVGGQFTYRRNLLKLNRIGLDLGDSDLDISVSDLYFLEQVYLGSVFHRSYVSLGGTKRFGLFNEIRLSVGGGQSKFVTGTGKDVDGVYQHIFDLQVGLRPGLIVFIMDNAALEASVDVVGFKYRHIRQIFNRVETGTRHTSGADFKINLLSIGLGVSIYL